MSSGQRASDVYRWIEFSVNLTATILYPINKYKKFQKHKLDNTDSLTLGDGRSSFSYQPSDFSNTTIGRELGGYEVNPSVSTVEKIASLVQIAEGAINLFRIIKALEAWHNFNNRENEINFLGLHIKQKHLTIIKYSFAGIILISTIAFIVQYMRDKVNMKSVQEKMGKILEIVQVVVTIVQTGVGVGLLIYLIVDLFNGRRPTLGYWSNLNFALNFSSSFLENERVEKRLAQNPKAYAITTGVFTVSRLTNALLTLNLENEMGLEIKTDKTAKGDDNTLFVYFCGTEESTTNQHKGFIEKIKAKHHIYFSGLGSKTFVYKKIYSSQLSPVSNEINRNVKFYTLDHSLRNITFVEKHYSGSSSGGYDLKDSESIASEGIKIIQEYLLKNPSINKVIFSGHSRGAAVGLSSFLHKVKDDKDMIARLKTCQVTNVFLDPVAGQTGNVYHMGEKWDTGKLYDDFYHIFENKTQFLEVYAKAAEFTPVPYLKDFNPARKFLHNPSNKAIHLARFSLGYTHSGMISDYHEYSDPYLEAKIETPFNHIVNLLNNAIERDFSDKKTFIDTTSSHEKLFAASNTNGEILKEIGNPRMREKVYEDNNGKKVLFSDFITSYKLV